MDCVFQGQSFSLWRGDKNRFEFRSAYTQRSGTLAEVQKLVANHAIETSCASVELAEIKKRLKQAEELVVLSQLAPPPANTNAEAPAVRLVPPLAEVTRTVSRKKTPAPKNHVNVVQMKDAKKRRSSGLNYLRTLTAGSAALEKSR